MIRQTWVVGALLGATVIPACGRSGFDVVVHQACEDAAECPEGFACWAGTCRAGEWEDIGGGPAASAQPVTSGWYQDPVTLALDREGRPTVAYNDASSIGARRWTGTAWEDLGSPGVGHSAALALDAGGRPWVTWSGPEIINVTLHAAVWDADAWQPLPTILTDAVSLYPSMTIDADGLAVVAVGRNGGAENVCVYRYEDDTWQTPCFGSENERPGLAVGSSGSLLLTYVWSRHVVLVQRRAGAWETVSADIEPHDGDGTTARNSPAVVGTPAGVSIAWTRGTGAALAVYLRQWAGGVWAELGGSASGGGLGTAEQTAAVALSATPDGEPVVAWSDGATLYLRYWTGTTWAELFGSATVGIYTGGAVGVKPALSVDDARVCVAFTSGVTFLGATDFDVRVRCALLR